MIIILIKVNGEKNDMAEESKAVMERKKFLELTRRLDTDNPDPDDLNLIRQEYSKNLPYYYEKSNMGQHAIAAMVEKVKANDFVKEELIMNAKAIQETLGYNGSSPIERLLIENVAMCWMNKTLVELWYSQNTMENVNGSTKWLGFCERKLTSVQKRYLRAVETLARVRKVTVSTIQINLAAHGAKQLIVANLHQKDKDKEQGTRFIKELGFMSTFGKNLKSGNEPGVRKKGGKANRPGAPAKCKPSFHLSLYPITCHILREDL